MKHSVIPENQSPVRVIDFGHPEWQTHLGGSFYGPEEHDGVTLNWVGEGRCWCVLTGLGHGHDLAARLEAAPLAPYGSELQEIRLVDDSNPARTLVHRIFPAMADGVDQRFRLPQGLPQVEFRWRRLGAPVLTVSANNQLVSRLEFAPRPDSQSREFLLRRELLEENTILTFEPNFGIAPEALDGKKDDRVLSFRFFRLSLFQLP